MVTAIRIIISFLCIHAFIAGLLLDAYCALIFTCVIMGIGYALYFGIQRLIVWMREVDAQYLGNVIHNNWRRIGQYLVYITAIVILCTSFFVDDNSIIKRLVPYANVIIGIFITFLVMLPDFEIGDTLALSLNNRLRVNVRNNFLLFKLYNVKVELEYQKYDEKTKDTISWPINMSGENLTALDGRWRGTEKSSQTFHTKNAFIWDDSYDEIICRVQVTHSVSRLIRVKEIKEY